MASYCDFATLKHGQYQFLKCAISNESCGYQRWCGTEGCIKHTNNFAGCVLRRKQMELEKEKIEKAVAENSVQKKKESGKKKYKVVVACDKFVIYVGADGQNVRLPGDFKLKAGDYLEI